jgi:hypothetical protein
MKMLFLLLAGVNLLVADLGTYRQMLDKSLQDSAASDRFYEQFKPVKENGEPILVGFKAMSEFMLCKHMVNPISQLSHFKKGRKLLESAISRERANPELLFFRLSTQSNIPSLLNYKMNINQDKLALISYLKQRDSADKVLHSRIKAYLLTNQYCSAEEKAMIRKL